MSNGSLEERLKEREEARNELVLKITSESLESLKGRLNELLQSGLSTIESGIEGEAERLKESTIRLYRLSLKNPLLIGVSIVLGLAIGSWSLSYYLSTTLNEQLRQIGNNKFELSHQEEALKGGHFFKSPEDGKFYVQVVPETEYQDRHYRQWAALKID